MIRKLLSTAVAATLAVTIAAQGPCFDTNFGPVLTLGDDEITAPIPLGFTFTFAGTAFTDVSVCANGYLLLGATNVATAAGGDYSPTNAELLASAQPRICPLWMDYNPMLPGSGQVFMDTATPGQFTLTWFRVYTYGTTIPTTMQIKLDAGSNITVTYGQLGTPSTFQNNTSIIGASPGAGAVSNVISLATRPQVVASNTFADVILRTPGQLLPYSNTKLQFTPTSPGWIIQDVACTPNVASTFTVGQGCPSALSPTIYEVFTAANPVDLNGRDLTFLPSGTDYIALTSVSPTWSTAATTTIAAGDDTSHLITLPFPFPYNGLPETSIYVSSNGFLTIGGTDPGALCCTGDPVDLVAGPPMLSGFWNDLNPTAGGSVAYGVDAVTGDFVVTWNAVPEYGTANFNTFQIALSGTGQFTFRWQTLVQGASFFLSGYSKGGGSPDPGATDLSTVNGAVVSGTIRLPLTLTVPVGSAPTLGGAFTLDTNNIAPLPNGVFSILLISNEIPGGIPLDALGLTGCTAYVVLPEMLSFFNLTLGAPTTSYLINIPNAAAFAGVTLMSQSVSDDLNANAFGFRVSNGIRWTIGL